MRKILIFLTFILSCSKAYKPALEIEKEGYKIKLLTEDGTLKERENKVKFIVNPKPNQFKAYLYMPEMPGMPAMTELFELNKNLEGKVFIPMSGEWQIIIEIDNKQIKENITIPLKEMKKHEHSQNTKESLINFFYVKDTTSYKEIYIEGIIEFPKNKVYKIVPKFSGYIINIYLPFEGISIKKGDKLFSFYSPDIFRIKNEFFITRDSLTIEKLRVLDLKIDDIFDDSIIFRSPISGKVSKIYLKNGDKFNEGDIIMEIVDNSQVLFIGDLRKSEANNVKVGDIIQVKNKKGYIKEILPSSDANFIKVLAIFENDGEFFENNYEVGKILKMIKGIVIPKDAVIRTGNKDIVYIYENGNFKKFEVEIITDVKDGYLVKNLKEGQKIVSKGVFLIDADARLK